MKLKADKVRKACGCGNKVACKILAAKKLLYLDAGAKFSFDMAEDKEHPNVMPFTGTLLLIDQASTKPPHGSNGHRIYVSKEAAERNLKSLIGMGVNYDSVDLDGHATQHKVGVINKAWIDGNKVKVKGIIYKKDFPKAEHDLKRPDLGMSMELANVYVRDQHEDIWHLEDFYFTGATILKKDAAAYYGTSLAAKAAEKESRAEKTKLAAGAAAASRKGAKMDKAKKKKAAAANGGSTDVDLLASALGRVVEPLIQEQRKTNSFMTSLAGEMEDVKGLITLQAAGKKDDDDDDEEMSAARREEEEDDDEEMSAARKEDDDDDDDDEEMSAARKKSDDDDDDDDDSDGEDDDDDDDLDAMEDLSKKDADMDPGEFNKDAGNRGNKTSVTRPPKQGDSQFENSIAKGRLKSAGAFPGLKRKKGMAASIQAASEMISELQASNRKLVKQIKAERAQAQEQFGKMKKRINKMNAQMERFADQEARRSAVPVDLRNLAAKAGYNLEEIRGNGQKLGVDAVDAMFAAAKEQGIELDVATRIGMKNRLLDLGLMDQGVEERPWTKSVQ